MARRYASTIPWISWGSARAGCGSGSSPCREAQPETTGPARLRCGPAMALSKNVGPELIARGQGSTRRSAALRAEVGQGQHAPLARGAASGFVPRPFCRSRAHWPPRFARARLLLPGMSLPGHVLVSREVATKDPWSLDAMELEREIVTIVGKFRLRLLSRGAPPWSPPPERPTGNFVPKCTAFPFRSPRQSSRFPCCGIRAWMPMQRIGGCAPVRSACMCMRSVTCSFAAFGNQNH